MEVVEVVEGVLTGGAGPGCTELAMRWRWCQAQCVQQGQTRPGWWDGWSHDRQITVVLPLPATTATTTASRELEIILQSTLQITTPGHTRSTDRERQRQRDRERQRERQREPMKVQRVTGRLVV